MQYGLANGNIFMVHHDSPQKDHGIYQLRFVKAAG
jgi:hypothetical protein